MRIRLIGLLAILGLSAGCSSPAEVRGAELRTVPDTVTADTTVTPTTPPSTAAPTIPPSTAPTEPTIATTTIPASSLKSEDELKIEYVITEFNRRDFKERVDRTFDIAVYGDLIEGKQLALVELALKKRKASTRYVLDGTTVESVVIDSTIAGNEASGTACSRNDLQVWDDSGTPDKSDDLLIDGTLVVAKVQYQLRRRGDSWVITDSRKSEGDCSSAF
jgi:hypothetical protein